MSIDHQGLMALQEGEEFTSLKAHPAFQKLVELAQKQVLAQWHALLTLPTEEIERARGFIEGANFVLEYADAKVVQAELVRRHAQEDQRAALESQFSTQAQQRAGGRRRMVPGATLD